MSLPWDNGINITEPFETVDAETTGKDPLIVLAKKTEQPNGKLRCCFCILVFKCCFESYIKDLILHSTAAPTLGPPVQPPPPPDPRQIISSNTQLIYNGWSGNSLKADLPVTEADLQRTVQEALPVALPSVKVWIDGADQPAADVIREDMERPHLPPELESIRSTILAMEYQGDTEDATHSPVDLLILNPIKKLCLRNQCTVRTNRNGVDSSGATLKNLRPDVLLWLPSGVLVLKGEDKAFGVDIREARQDLRDKINVFSDTFFGSVPYQFAYACSGSFLQFCAFMRTDDPHRPREIQLTELIDLSTMMGRSLCVRYAINIARILLALQQNHPDGNVIGLGKTIETPSSKVVIFGDYVLKKTKHYTSQEVIEALYQVIKSSSVPHLIFPKALPKIRRSTLSVNLMPVGFCGYRPMSVSECKRAARHILFAVEWLHGRGFVHRDLRPVNVMWSNQQWYLIDLEWANFDNLPMGGYNPHLHPPECVNQDFKWGVSADMWQYGKLLEHWNLLDNNGSNLVRTLTQNNPTFRPSASEALATDFFLDVA